MMKTVYISLSLSRFLRTTTSKQDLLQLALSRDPDGSNQLDRSHYGQLEYTVSKGSQMTSRVLNNKIEQLLQWFCEWPST